MWQDRPMNQEPPNPSNQANPAEELVPVEELPAEELMAEWNGMLHSPNEVSREWEYPEDHNPYEEISRLKKAAKIAVRLAIEIADRGFIVNPATVNDNTIKLVADQIGQTAPSNRTIELVHEILGTTVPKK